MKITWKLGSGKTPGYIIMLHTHTQNFFLMIKKKEKCAEGEE